MNHTDILNLIAKRRRVKQYLEIGVRNPQDNFDKIVCPERSAVDPRPCSLPAFGSTWELFCMTSDQFFALYPERQFGLVFVDGDHSQEQATRDVAHALASLRWSLGGTIVMHDCNPPDEAHTSGGLCGTVYRAFLQCRANRHLDCYCVDCDYGVGIVRISPNRAPLVLPSDYTYADFAEHRKEWLNLVDPSDVETP